MIATPRAAARRSRCRLHQPPTAALALAPLLAVCFVGGAGTSLSIAQEWEIHLSNPTLTPATPTTEVTISAYVPHPELFAAAEWSTHASERGWDEASFEALLMSGFGQSPGALSPDGRSVLGQEALFIPLLGPPIPSPLPIWRGTFTATDFAQPREIAIWTRTDLFEVYVDFGPPLVSEPRVPGEALAMIQVVPAPAAIVLLGAGAAVAIRRRRDH